MIRRCSWCDTYMGEKPGPPGSENTVTHGLCISCDVEVRVEAGLPPRRVSQADSLRAFVEANKN